MKNNKKLNLADIIIILILLITTGVTFYYYPRLPRIIPTHFGISGKPDGWGAKSTLFMLGGLNLAIAVLMPLSQKIDPKKDNYARFQKVWDLFRVFITFMLGALQMMMIMTAFDENSVDVGTTIMALIGVMFLLLGNYMPKVKHNYMFGIKTPWTIRDVRVWEKTHRMAGPIWAAIGLIIIASSFTPLWRSGNRTVVLAVFVGVMLIGAIVPMAYSYFLFNSLNTYHRGDGEAVISDEGENLE